MSQDESTEVIILYGFIVDFQVLHDKKAEKSITP